jgi:anti-sigma regulatory factor (Ser/Thr protein kinase)
LKKKRRKNLAKGRISIELKNKLSELDTLHENLEKFGKAIGLPEKCLFEIDLALEEIITNIISYGLLPSADQCIQVTMSHEGKKVIIQIEDCGVPFNLLKAGPPDLECSLEESKVGGLGIHLIKRMMNDVVYERCGDKNVVILKKNIK